MKRGLTALLLVAGIAACIFWLLRSGFFDPSFEDKAEKQLAARIALYETSRRADDWDAIYKLVDPEQREAFDKNRFLRVFGSGVLRIIELKTLSSEIDTSTRTAKTVMATEGELVMERLPAKYRQSLRVADPKDLRRNSELELEWVWRSGDWYYRIESNAVSGRDNKGNQLKPIQPSDTKSQDKKPDDQKPGD